MRTEILTLLCYSAHVFWRIVDTCRWDWRSWLWNLYVASKWRTQRLIERKGIIISKMKAGFGIATFLMFYYKPHLQWRMFVCQCMSIINEREGDLWWDLYLKVKKDIRCDLIQHLIQMVTGRLKYQKLILDFKRVHPWNDFCICVDFHWYFHNMRGHKVNCDENKWSERRSKQI